MLHGLSVQFRYSVMSDSLRPHGLQHTSLPCPSLSPGIYSDSCPLSQRCYLTISSFVIPFSSCPQSFPAPESFPRSQLFTSGGQHIGASASASVLPVNIQGWFLLGLTGLISLQFKGLSRVFYSTTVQKHQFFGVQLSLWSNSYLHTWLLEKLTDYTGFVGKVMSLLFKMLSNHFILCRSLLLFALSPFSIRVFSKESALHIRWPTYWSFSFSISPSNEYSGLTSFRIGWIDLLAIQRTLKNLL